MDQSKVQTDLGMVFTLNVISMAVTIMITIMIMITATLSIIE